MLQQCPPVFIVGSPRSGTTLLAGLLDGTPWGSPFETHFIPKYAAAAARANLDDRRAFTDLARLILRERPIAQHRLSISSDELYDSLPSRDYASLVDAIGRACGRQRGAASWGDKTPHYIHDVGLLHALFPRAKMIYVVRDGRDVALSLLDKPWGPASVYGCALKWRDENRLQPILDTLRAHHLLHDLRYEDLLKAPVAALTSLYEFLDQDVPLDEVIRRAGSIRRDNCGGWQRRLAPAQIALFEQVAGQTLVRFGYPVTYQPRAVALPTRLAWRAQDAAKHAVNLFQMNVVDTLRIRFFGMEPFGQ